MALPNKDLEFESKGIPEAVTVKQEILKDYFRCKNIAMVYRDKLITVSAIDDSLPFKSNELGSLMFIKGKFEAALSGLYLSLLPYNFNKTEEDQLKYLDSALSSNNGLKWEYLIKCLKTLGKTIKRLGISDFPIDMLPPDKSWMEGFNR